MYGKILCLYEPMLTDRTLLYCSELISIANDSLPDGWMMLVPLLVMFVAIYEMALLLGLCEVVGQWAYRGRVLRRLETLLWKAVAVLVTQTAYKLVIVNLKLP